MPFLSEEKLMLLIIKVTQVIASLLFSFHWSVNSANSFWVSFEDECRLVSPDYQPLRGIPNPQWIYMESQLWNSRALGQEICIIILLLLSNRTPHWFTAVGSDTISLRNTCYKLSNWLLPIWFEDRRVQARFFVSYLTPLRVVRYAQRIWLEPDSLSSNNL